MVLPEEVVVDAGQSTADQTSGGGGQVGVTLAACAVPTAAVTPLGRRKGGEGGRRLAGDVELRPSAW